MNNKILVVEEKNGKIIKKYYITKKEAQKHMNERHERLDRYKKTTKKHKGEHQQGGRKNKTRARTYKKNRTCARRKFH